jgi:membrane fusion protein (multidrug efflux system)
MAGCRRLVTTEELMKTRGKVWILAIVGIVLVIVALVGIKVGQIRAMIQAGKSFVPPPESVTSAKVSRSSWQSRREAIGTLVAVHDVTLGAELPGLIREVAFDSGQNLKRGALLVKLDTTNEEAQLASATADLALAKASMERAEVLRKAGANTPADFDTAAARTKQAEANVGNLRATISKKTIRAPFDGRVAIRQVERGQVVSPGTPIATLQSVDPMYAEFSLPQQALADLKVGQLATMRVDSFPTRKWEGKISTINSEVDATTRNVRVRAQFPNRDGTLRPGLFVNVDVHAADNHEVVVIPATAVVYAPYGDSVFVITSEKSQPGPAAGGASSPTDGHAPAAGGGGDQPALVVEPRFVRLGEKRGDLVAVVSGLKEGETVVSNGAFKLRKGAHVIVNDSLAPTVELDPKPADN